MRNLPTASAQSEISNKKNQEHKRITNKQTKKEILNNPTIDDYDLMTD